MTSSTPKNSVNPTATSAYIMPSISPFITYWARSPKVMLVGPALAHPHSSCAGLARASRSSWHCRALLSEMAGTSPAMTNGFAIKAAIALFLSRQLALAGGVLAVVPLNEFAVLDHVARDHRHGVLTVIVERDLADDRIAILHIGQLRDDLLAIRPGLLDGVEKHLHGRECERAIGLRRAVVFLRVVLLLEELAARQLLGRRTFAKGERALGQRSEPLDIGVRYDTG